MKLIGKYCSSIWESMDILDVVVCVKDVLETAEAELRIDAGRKAVEKTDLETI